MRCRISLCVLSLALGLAWSCQEAPEESAESCSESDPCPGDFYCKLASSGGGGGCGMASSGICIPRAKRGEVCSFGQADWRPDPDFCVQGLICHRAFDPPRCDRPSGPGARCSDSFDCTEASGQEAICDVSRPPEPHLGVCAGAGTVPPGAACLEDRACAGGLACRPDRDGRPVCRGPGVDGDRCDGTYDPDCEPGHFCSWEYPRVCRAALGDGERCSPGTGCAEGLVCREDDERCGPPSQPGGPCGGGHDCAAGSSCVDGTCAARGDEGAPCEGEDRCATGLRCIDRTCSRKAGEGDRCEATQDCLYGLSCKAGSCRPPWAWSPEGGACERTYDCLNRRPCVGGTCVPRSAAGGKCAGNEDCEQDLFCQLGSTFGSGTCRERLPAGSACLSEYTCSSLACDFSGTTALCAD